MNLVRDTFTPANRNDWLAMRKLDITSTDAAALFGMSKYMTAFEVACLKSGEIEDSFKENERSEWGAELEDVIARRIGLKYGVMVQPKKTYIRLPLVRAGASFDYEIVGITDTESHLIEDCSLRTMFSLHGPGLLEIKNVDYLIFRDEWQVGEKPEAPPHIEIQLQHQLFVSGYSWGCIGAFVAGNKLHLIIRMSDPEVHFVIAKRVAKFWGNLEQGIYPPAAQPEDNWIVKKLYEHAEPGKLLDASGDKMPPEMLPLVREYLLAAREEKKAKDRKETAHVNLLKIIGEHEKVISDIATISCGMVAETRVEAFTRKAFRYWKITPKKGFTLEPEQETKSEERGVEE